MVAYPVGSLWKPTGGNPVWRLFPEPSIWDPAEAWLKPDPTVESLLPEIPSIVASCIEEFEPYLRKRMEARITGAIEAPAEEGYVSPVPDLDPEE